MKKYLKVFKISVKNNVTYLKDFLIGNIFTVIIAIVFFFLWKKLYAQNIKTGFTFQEMMWYLIVGQSFTLNYNRIHRNIGQDVKSGDIAYKINKPYNYTLYILFDTLGRNLLDFFIGCFISFAVGMTLVGPIKGYKFYYLFFSMIIMLCGVILNHIIHITISLSALWVEENMPYAWIYGKFIFVFGGLLYPISLLPKWMFKVNFYMPWSYVIYHVSKTVVKFNLKDFLFTFLGQIIYIIIFLFLMLAIYRRGVKMLNVNGG